MAQIDTQVLQLDPSIRDNVAKMIEEANTRYRVLVRVNQTQRTREQAQSFHVLHMYLYNYFPHLKPKIVAADGRTISWDHMKDPNIKWVLIDDRKSDFLRTKDGNPGRLVVSGSGAKTWVVEPEQSASTRAMADYLKIHHVSSMAAPGVDGCGEPCGCGGHASKHVSGKACDLSGLEELGLKIRAAEPGKYSSPDDAVDQFLHDFHLWRPLAHLEGKARELWHVEGLPAHVPKSKQQTHKAQTRRRAPHYQHIDNPYTSLA